MLNLSAPLYIDQRHLFGEVPKTADKAKEVHGPVYLEGQNEHGYQEVPKAPITAKEMTYPIYLDEESAKHCFSQIERHLDTLKDLKGPVYNVDHECKFNEFMSKVDQLKSLQGPAYDIGESDHHYEGIKQNIAELKNLVI